MSETKRSTQAPIFDFDKAKSAGGISQSIVRRPVVQWTELAGEKNDNKSIVVCGHLVCTHRMNNPKGAKRDTDFWLAAVIRLTHECPVIVKGEKGDERIIAKPGDEVYVPFGSDGVDLAKHIEPLLGHPLMFWVAIRPDGVVKLDAGRNPMRKFEVLVGEANEFAPLKRVGKDLALASKDPLIIDAPEATQAQVNNARETVNALQG